MMLFFELLTVLLAGFGGVCLGWLIFGRLLLPVGTETVSVRAVVDGWGDGSGLEQTVSALRWLRVTGLWQGEILLVDRGLDSGGLAAAQRLGRLPGVTLVGGSAEERK